MSLKSQIEDKDAEITYNHEECLKNKEYMKFLNWLIKEFRPRLAPEGGLQPLAEEFARLAKAKSGKNADKDSVFMTEQQESH